MGWVNDLYLRFRFFDWVVDGGIKLWDRLTE